MRFSLEELPETVTSGLLEFTRELEAIVDFRGSVVRAEDLWHLKNTKSNRVMGPVRDACWRARPGARKLCRWCERSEADEIDHVAPRRHFPTQTFRWSNFVPSCGPCNTRKSDRTAILLDGRLSVIHRREPPSPPPSGPLALISPRTEDPLTFLELDLQTGLYGAALEVTAHEQERAQYTIEILGLNRRADLVDARKEAIRSVRRMLDSTLAGRIRGDESLVREARDSIQRMHFPAVWESMRRQRQWYDWLRDFFDALPDALSW